MKIFRLLVSSKLMLLLLILFAGAMAIATFIENDYGTATAWHTVYESWWFEMVMVLLAINFLANIKKYRLFTRQKWPIGLFHIAFVLIIIAAGITRYFSHSGTIHIREGKAEQTYYSNDHFLQIKEIGKDGHRVFEMPLKLTAHTFQPQNVSIPFDQPFNVRIKEYIPNAQMAFENGDKDYLDLALTLGEGRQDITLSRGKTLSMKNISLGTEKEGPSPIKVYKRDGTWMISSDLHLQIMQMSTQEIGVLHAGEKKPLQLRTLYQWEDGAFMLKSINEESKLVYVEEKDPKIAENLPDAVKIEILADKNKIIDQIYFPLVKLDPDWKTFNYQGKTYQITYGPKAHTLPFSVYLKDFQMERYPGSQSPSSYASEVVVKDGQKNLDFRIYMNNVLDYRGYRFYQTSYDTDEKGTVLSINQDYLGSTLTYIGYFLLVLGMFFSLFTLNSRFQHLNSQLKKIKKSKYLLPMFLFCSAIPLHAEKKFPEWVIPEKQAAEYGKLIVQDLDGRMKPLNTLAHEIVRKLAGSSQVQLKEHGIHLSPEQFLLAVQMYPEMLSKMSIIKIDKEKGYNIFKELGIDPQPAISFMDFLGPEGQYKLQQMVERANLLKPAERNEGDNELLEVDERFNIFYGLLTGDFLKLFPNRLDENNTWYTKQNYQQGFDEEDAQFVKHISNIYLQGLQKGLETGKWTKAEESLDYIDLFQRKAGKEVYPSDNRIKAELLYTKLNLGSRLFGYFWVLGILMLGIALWKTFHDANLSKVLWKIGLVLSGLGMLAFTFHLGLRWYIARHPPRSDGFEMLVFVGWGALIFGLIFSKKSRFTLPFGLLFSGTLLFVAFLEWLNPEITNLMPVLHSYWLKIHVAIIVSSYAPLALAAVMALLALLLIIFRPNSSGKNWWNSLLELAIVNELSITIGLFLLTIGTFLGGVWANESWGRYWAWDPKETWALISIMVYACVLHLRLVPGLKNFMVYHLASLWAFSSIIMTSFGVNYYLSGLHSYAKGDPVPVPTWVYWTVAILLIISIAAGIRYNGLSKETKAYLKV
ncbi:cytochrome c biogenesis protein CcsA [Echinicola jeungdonensis]|uniref:Cytochrome c biogenesis protein CcsA n=1 Tax=Echinicola jeungdonensis TaxID=709343 RepID=A0ABV5J7C1_9BACT|nr:cytochrome c biogenesis protein CcsA [Echinicola jeungdonensis]MDN3669114.1 cytochrome c biogenesis protein CcsA [Echinicola jeungdonensis]